MNFKLLSDLFKFLCTYKSGDIIYSSVICRNFKTNRSDANTILDALEKLGIVESKCDVYCPVCNRLSGNLHNAYHNIPKCIVCKHCNEEFEKGYSRTTILYIVK